jgi:hypothetical protein
VQAGRYVAQRGHPCPPHVNLADHLLRLVSTDFLADDERDDRSRSFTNDLEEGLIIGDVGAWAHNWRMEEVKNEVSIQSHLPTKGKPKARGGALFHATLVLTQRNCKQYHRLLIDTSI